MIAGNPMLAATSDQSFEKARGLCGEPSSFVNRRVLSDILPSPSANPLLKLLAPMTPKCVNNDIGKRDVANTVRGFRGLESNVMAPMSGLAVLQKLVLKTRRRLGRIAEKLGLVPPAAARCSNGRLIYIDRCDERGRSLMKAAGDFNPNTLSMWRMLLGEQAWTHVIDVGANYGEMLVGADLPPEAVTIALEPNPCVLPYLQRTLKEAHIDVRLLAVAASDRAGTVTLNIDREWSGTSSVAGVLPEAVGHPFKAIEVPATTLAAIIADDAGSARAVRLLAKIDVESYEVPVLRGLGDTLAALDEFAALAEFTHLPEPDMQWLLANFTLQFLQPATGRLGAIEAATPAELHKLLEGDRYYRNDVVLRRHSRR